jgi:hypothetical protein
MSDFYFCNQIPNIDNLKGGEVYFGSWLQSCQSMITWPCCFAPEVVHWWEFLVEDCSLHHGRTQRIRQKGAIVLISPSRVFPNNVNLPLSFIS